MAERDLIDIMEENFSFFCFLNDHQKEAYREMKDDTNKNVIVSIKSLGGKTSSYQLARAALTEDGMTLVISPSRVLTEQQLEFLNKKGKLKAVTIDNSFDFEDRDEVFHDLKTDRAIKFFFVSPEIIGYGGRVAAMVRELMESNLITRVVIDNGLRQGLGEEKFHKFRENISYLRDVRELFPEIQWTVMTTSSDDEINFYANELGMQHPKIIREPSYDRGDIFYDVKIVSDQRSAVFEDVVKLLSKNCNCSGLIYTQLKNSAEIFVTALQSVGINTAAFYSDHRDRSRNHQLWQENKIQVLVATTESFRYAGVKKRLDFVFHDHVPGNLSFYYQESGRANREAAISRIYADSRDDSQIDIVATIECRHKVLAKIFGNETEACRNRCDNCVASLA